MAPNNLLVALDYESVHQCVLPRTIRSQSPRDKFGSSVIRGAARIGRGLLQMLAVAEAEDSLIRWTSYFTWSYR